MSMTALAGDERLPLYQRLAEVLRRDVMEGVRRPGDRMPSETALSAEYGLAPGTVRQALSALVDDGLLERFHGRGTFVRRPSFDRSLFRFFRFRDASGEWRIPESRILKRSVEPAPSHIARQLRIKDGEPAISMSRLRLLNEAPVLAEEIWLPKARFGAFLDLSESAIGPLLYPVYDAQCGQLVARAEETLTAEPASRETARLLRIDTGAPVIVIDRLAKGFDDTPLEWRRSKGRADQFHYHTEIR